MYYFLLVVAAILYALSFYFNRNVERQCKDGIDTAILLSAISWAELLVILLVVMRGKMQFTLFSGICALLYAVFLIVFALLNLKAFAVVDLSKYSLFTMLGGMLVPFAFGVLFFNEELTIGKIICCVLVSIGLYIDNYGGKISKKALVYLFAVFFINGSFGVISTLHQNSSRPHVDTLQYMSMISIAVLAFSLIWFASRKATKKLVNPVINKKAYLNMMGYGIFYGGAELILLFAIKHVNASVQYPIITGGVIIISTVISMLIGENKNRKSLIPTAITFVGLLFLI